MLALSSKGLGRSSKGLVGGELLSCSEDDKLVIWEASTASECAFLEGEGKGSGSSTSAGRKGSGS